MALNKLENQLAPPGLEPLCGIAWVYLPKRDYLKKIGSGSDGGFNAMSQIAAIWPLQQGSFGVFLGTEPEWPTDRKRDHKSMKFCTIWELSLLDQKILK